MSRSFGELVAIPFTKAQVHHSVKPLGCASFRSVRGCSRAMSATCFLEHFFKILGGCMRNLRFILGITILALLSSLVAFAQTGSIQGTVTDKTGAVIDGASVTVTSLDTKATRVVTTGGTGGYTVPNLPAGHYEIV